MGQITHIDCFAGPGGVATGFHAAGIKTVLALEKVDSCVDTYHANYPDVPIIHKDIRHVTPEEIKQHVNGRVDVLSAGMPCETFSTAGSKSRSFYDFRQVLFREAIRIADITESQLILFENVPGITTKKVSKGSDKFIINEIFETLAEYGYKYHIDTLMNAADFGIPQYRERYFILASREALKLRFPVSKTNSRVSVKDALEGLPFIDANDQQENLEYTSESSEYVRLLRNDAFWKLPRTSNNLTYHIAPKHRTGTIERFSYLEPGEGLKNLFDKFDEGQLKKLQDRKVLPKKWYIQRNRRLQEDDPSVTVTSHCLDELVHPNLNRALTVREVARLQSFPDAYDFLGGPVLCPHMYETQDKYEQIGDAVPPLLAYRIGLTIKEVLENGQ